MLSYPSLIATDVVVASVLLQCCCVLLIPDCLAMQSPTD
jgi:hypothetical protein